MAEQKKTNVWLFAGIGCGVIVLLGVAAVVVAGFLAVRGAKKFEAEMKDPVARTEKVMEVLGTDHLPEGYHAMVAFSIPFVMETAIITDEPPGADGLVTDMGERGLIYVNMFLRQDKEELRDYFEGRTSDSGVLSRNNIRIDIDEIIGRGTVPMEHGTLMYVALRGGVNAHGHSGEGITSVILVDCPGDSRLRTAIWFAPDPSPHDPIEDLDLAGTPADEAAIADFLGDFRFCD
jgi:hypothetical protein